MNWKKTIILALCALLVLPAVIPVGSRAEAADGAQYTPLTVPNSSFEEPMKDGAIPHWTTIPATAELGPNLFAEASTDRAAIGSHSLKMVDNDASHSLEVQSSLIPITEEQTYRLRTQVYVEAKSVRVYVRFKKSGSNTDLSGGEINILANTVGSWNTVELEAYAPKGAEYAQITFYYGASGTGTIAYLDDVRFDQKQEQVSKLNIPYSSVGIDLGEPVKIGLSQAAAFGIGPDGKLEQYVTTTGTPTGFAVADAITGEIKFSERVSGTSDPVWGIAQGSDGNIYFASTGKLFRYWVAEKRIENLGDNPTGNTMIYDIEASSDGKIYGSTFHSTNMGKIFEYDIATNTFTDLGVAQAGETYVRGLGLSGQYLYAVTGTNARLVRIDRHSGDKQEIIIPGITNQAGKTLSDVDIYNGLLFLHAGPEVHIIKDGTYEHVRTTPFQSKMSAPSPDNPTLVYYKVAEELYSYDTSTDTVAKVEGIHQPLPDTAFKTQEWLTPDSGPFAGKTVLFSMAAYGETFVYDPERGQYSNHLAGLTVIGTPVNVLEHKNGLLFASGFQRGMSIYDTASNRIIHDFPSFHQTEGIGFFDDIVYFGTYTGANMYRLDLSKPIDYNGYGWGNPGLALDIQDDQNRPFTIESGDGQVFIGTFPASGFEGALTVLEEIQDESKTVTGVTYETFRNIMPNQSIIGLAYHNGLLYGSTTVYSGSGSASPAPIQPEAGVFIFNPKTKQIENTITPKIDGISGEVKIIGELSVGPDGLIWGILDAFVNTSVGYDAAVFALDPNTFEVVKAKKITQSPYNTSKYRPYYIRWGNDGLMYSTIGRKLIAIDPQTLESKEMLPGKTVNVMTMADNGDIYYIDGTKLYKLPIAINVTNLSLDTDNLVSGQTANLSISIVMADGSQPNMNDTTISYVSSNENILSIQGHQVTAKAPGKATVKAIVSSNGVSVTSQALEIHVLAINNAPTISTISDQTIQANSSTALLPFVIGDIDSDISSLTVSASSNNTLLVPDANIILGGELTERTVIITPEQNKTGQATITLSVSDETHTASSSFILNVTAVPGGGSNYTGGIITIPAYTDHINIVDSSKPIDSVVLQQALRQFDRITITTEDIALLPAASLASAKDGSTISISTNKGAFLLEPSKLPLKQWADQLGISTDDLYIRIGVEAASPNMTSTVQQTSSAIGAELLSDVYEFSISIESDSGRSMEITDLGSLYLQRTIVLSDAVDAEAFVALYDASTQTLRFVPSIVSGTEANFWRTGNSLYAVVKADRSFRDTDNHWAKDNIKRMADRLIVNGISDIAFEPERGITRAEFAAILNRSLGLLSNSAKASAFNDVDPNAWYAYEVGSASYAGLINGYEDGSFQPHRNVTRAEAAAMIIRALSFAGMELSISSTEAAQILQPFKDVNEAAWAQKELALAVQAGLLKGKAFEELQPSASIKRAEAAVLLERMLVQAGFMPSFD